MPRVSTANPLALPAPPTEDPQRLAALPQRGEGAFPGPLPVYIGDGDPHSLDAFEREPGFPALIERMQVQARQCGELGALHLSGNGERWKEAMDGLCEMMVQVAGEPHGPLRSQRHELYAVGLAVLEGLCARLARTDLAPGQRHQYADAMGRFASPPEEVSDHGMPDGFERPPPSFLLPLVAMLVRFDFAKPGIAGVVARAKGEYIGISPEFTSRFKTATQAWQRYWRIEEPAEFGKLIANNLAEAMCADSDSDSDSDLFPAVDFDKAMRSIEKAGSGKQD